MKNQNIEQQLNKLSKVFHTDNVITSEQVEQVLEGIISIMTTFKKDNEQLTAEAKQVVNALLERTIDENSKLYYSVANESKVQREEMLVKINSSIKEIRALMKEIIRIKPADGLPGKDADEESIVEKVLTKIKLPDIKETVLDDGIKIKDKLESLKGKNKLDYSALKNAPDLTSALSKIGKGGGGSNLEAFINGAKIGSGSKLNLIGSGVTATNDGSMTSYTITGGAGGQVNSIVAGTGITVNSIDPVNPVITNSAPDQTVAITNGTGITHSGTYPNFTITNSAPFVDAVSDGNTYGRKDGTWSQVIAGTGDVIAPATNTANYIPQWNGANSKTLKDGLAVPTGGLAGITLVGTKQDKLTFIDVKTANYTANANEYVPCDISAGGFAVTLPSAPADDTTIVTKLIKVDSTTILEVKASGTDVFNIAGGNTSVYFQILNNVATFTYKATTGIWYLETTAPPSAFAMQFPGVDATTPITNANISINTSTRVLTITPPLGYFYINVDGNGKNTRIRKTGTINFPAFTDTSGTWYFYFNTAGTAVTTQTPWTTADFSTNVPMYRLVWNASLFSFTVTAATATKGDTYTNNSSTFTVMESISGGTTLICSRTTGTNNPQASGNLTRATGAGTNPIVFSAFSESVKMVAQYIEYHLNDIPADTHAWFHLQGAQWASGFTMANNALTANAGNVDGRNSVIALTTGTNLDDNLEYTITNNTTGNPFTQDLGDTTPATLTSSNSGLFKTFTQNAGGLVYFMPATRFPFPSGASNYMQYVTSVGVQTDVANGKFATVFVYATQNPVSGEAIKVVSATQQFDSIALARAFNWIDIQNTYSILNEGEIRPLYRLIYEVRDSYNVAIKHATLRETQDLRKAAITSTTAATGSIPASSVTVVPSGSLSTNAQSSLEALDSGKIPYLASTLTASQIMATDASSNITSLAVATYPSLTELAYVKGVTSAVQTQLNAKLPLAGGTMTGKVVSAGRSEVAKTYTPATGSQTVALDASVNNMHVVTGHADGTAITFTITGMTDSQPIIVMIKQGSGTVSTIASWFSGISWCGGSAPTLTATLSKTDTFGFIRTGSNTYTGYIIGQNA